jgi:hypothetical protein
MCVANILWQAIYKPQYVGPVKTCMRAVCRAPAIRRSMGIINMYKMDFTRKEGVLYNAKAVERAAYTSC